MQAVVLLLPALAALCQSAALPQVLGTTGSIPSLPQTTYTFVIPCPPGTNGCVPRTVTMVEGDGGAFTIVPRTANPEDSQESDDATPTLEARQVLGSPTRTVLESPTPPWGYPGWPGWPGSPSVITVTITETITAPAWTDVVPPLTVPINKREPQVLGSPTRTVLESPTPPPWWPHSHPHSHPEPTTRTISPLTVPIIDKRQELGSPTRTVLESPTPPPWWWPPYPGPWTTRWPTDPEPTTLTVPPLTVPIEERQELGGDPSASISWYTGGDDGMTATVTLGGW